MNKIPTIFERDFAGNRKVVNKPVVKFGSQPCVATEKLDGTNVRITVRNHTCVRLEKRRNPDKIQKLKGITEPWYVDADPNDPGDKYIYAALNGTILAELPEGEWSGEAIGENIQGNPLGINGNTICLFSLGKAPLLFDVPIELETLKVWLPEQKSAFNAERGIEGVVWHFADGSMAKIKTKDF